MYRIVIVDDEPLFRKALLTLIDWESSGFTVTYEAVHGLDALEHIRSNPVDILITDIRMPVMDGLELLKEISNDFPSISTVMLSSYDDFHLVRDAFKLGACDYILKTDLTPESVLGALGKLSEILEMRSRAKESSALSQDSKSSFDTLVLKDKFFKELIWGCSYTPKTLEIDMKRLGIKLTSTGLILVVLCADNFLPIADSTAWDDKRQLLSFAILNIMEEKLTEFTKGSVFSYSQSEFVMIFNFHGKHDYQHHVNQLGGFFEDLRKCLEAYLHIHISAGVSNMEDGYQNLSRLYTQASNALKYGSVMGKGRFIIHSIYHHPASDVQDLTDFVRNAPLALQSTLDSLEAAKIREAVPGICLYNRYIPLDFIEDIYKLYDRYEFILSAFASRNNLLDTVKPLLEEYKKLRISSSSSLRDYDLWLRNSLEQVCGVLSIGQDIIGRAKKYIHTNYQKDISLDSAADFLGTTPSHLSRIFARETGVNFVDYLTDVRIHHAKEYIQNTNMKLYEIAEQVGFNSVEYFSKVFKKKTGKSPKRQK